MWAMDCWQLTFLLGWGVSCGCCHTALCLGPLAIWCSALAFAQCRQPLLKLGIIYMPSQAKVCHAQEQQQRAAAKEK